ncbi:MAG: sialate O-acetylesterase [Planctomycetota bacterium]
MKQLYLSCLSVALLALGSVSVQADEITVFLLAGQSNMAGRADADNLAAGLRRPQSEVQLFDGTTNADSFRPLAPDSGTDFGPEVTFGQSLIASNPDARIALIKSADGGTNLSNDWDPNQQNNNYTAFTDTVALGLQKLADQGHNVTIGGMLWTQGETDAFGNRTQAQYANDLTEFIAAVRGSYGQDLPFFLSRLSDNQTAITTAGYNSVRAAQDQVAANDPNAFLIDTDGFGIKSDDLHFNAQGQVSLGEAFATAVSEVVPIPEPTTAGILGVSTAILLIRRTRPVSRPGPSVRF